MCYFLMYKKCGDVPLGTAAHMGHIKVVERLLQAKANVNSQNKVLISQNNSVYYVLLHSGVALLSTWPH